MKITNIKNRQYLESIPLPVYTTGNYAVVKHTKAIDIIEKCLQQNDLQIVKEFLYTQSKGDVAGGNLTLSFNVDEESDCVVTFLNSYNKQFSFRVNAALRMRESGNLFVLSNSVYGNYKRVHKGKANKDIEDTLCHTIQHIKNDFYLLTEQKNKLKNIILDQEDIIFILGDMFFNDDILNSEQVNFVKHQLKEPTYTYNCETCSAFHIYMLCALSFQNRGHMISKFYESHKKLNTYFIEKYNALTEGNSLFTEINAEVEETVC